MTVTLHESKHSGYTEISGRLHPSLSSAPAPLDLTDESLEALARLAEPEPWKTATLRAYLQRTLDRLHQQQKITGNLFNTGLATPLQEAIVGIPAPGGPRWLAETDPAVPFVPPAATYGEPVEFVYDARRDLVVRPKQLLADPANLSVLPTPLATNPYQAGLVLEGAVRRAEARVRRSYRVGVPSWDDSEGGRIRLLLPLSLTTPETVDVALAVVPDGETYRGAAILPLDAAYAQARQIARPVEWL